MKRLGIIDWGIGGVSIYKLIREKIGDVPTTYVSDTGVTPYGKMTRHELAGRLNVVIQFLRSCGVTHIIIGCNAASTAIPFLKDHGVPLEGVIGPAVAMTAKLKPSKIGLIGGRRTVVSGVYRRAFAELGIDVNQRIAQPLSGLIENGDISSKPLQTQAKQILTPIKNSSHILLACTHYPAIVDVLRHYVSPTTEFIDPAREMVKIVKRWNLGSLGNDEFLTSGDVAAMKRAAKNAFGVKIERVVKIKL
ncbi:MAG: aspartate/glutamate racemase family protein [Pyrinomonadaceae bacterium]